MIKLIASDLDGTLIGEDMRFRPRTLQALHAAADAGIRIIFITGRPLRWMGPVFEQLGAEWNGENSYAFCSNGAVTYDLARGEVVATRVMTGAQVRELHAELEATFPGALFIAETLNEVFIQGGAYEPHVDERDSKAVQGQILDLVAEDAEIVKYLIFQDGATPADLLEQVRSVVGERATATRSVPYQPLVEIAQRGLHKGRVLADFAAEHGIEAADIAAFGDMPNDLEMLTWAGHGYAMASGLPDVQQKVGRVCPAFDEDGVAQVLEGMMRPQG